MHCFHKENKLNKKIPPLGRSKLFFFLKRPMIKCKDLGRFYLCKDCYTVPSYRLVFPRKDEGKKIV